MQDNMARDCAFTWLAATAALVGISKIPDGAWRFALSAGDMYYAVAFSFLPTFRRGRSGANTPGNEIFLSLALVSIPLLAGIWTEDGQVFLLVACLAVSAVLAVAQAIRRIPLEVLSVGSASGVPAALIAMACWSGESITTRLELTAGLVAFGFTSFQYFSGLQLQLTRTSAEGAEAANEER